MIGVREADQLLRAHVRERAAEWCPLEAAAGAVLRQDITADRPLPACDRVAMDGIAVATAALGRGVRRFRVEGRQRAGAVAGALSAGDACLEVMTGSPLPAGADCVIQVEDVRLADGWAELLPDARTGLLLNVQPRGCDRAPGAVLVPAGARLTAPRIAVAASVGCARVRVSERPRIAVVSTGDEVVPVDCAPGAHQVRCANSPALRAALLSAGFPVVETFHYPDEMGRLRSGLETALAAFDVVVVSGGVSMGGWDLVPRALEAAGVQRHFHRVRQKPGKPFWFGTAAGGSMPVFALPGNPVSALVCLHRYVIPALRRACGEHVPEVHATLAADVPARAGLTQFVPVRLEAAAGLLHAHPVPIHSSADLAALAPSDGLVEVGETGACAGQVVPYYAWS